MDLSLLSRQERLEIELSLLFTENGFSRIKLSQFDEYELFHQHRAFLSGEQMLTFTDPRGKLYALRPDVTLSVLKQAAYQPEECIKVYYKEDVFRMSAETHSYEAGRQIGIERIEKQNPSQEESVLLLAQQALMLLPVDTVLVLSHMDFLDRNEWFHSLREQDQIDVLHLISRKNRSDLEKFLTKKACPSENYEELLMVLDLVGSPDSIEEKLESLISYPDLFSACLELVALSRMLPADDHHRIMIDFSLVNSLNYYNGLIFQGFAEGCRDYVLSGGRYDRLARQFMPDKESCGAIGFALSLDVLEPIVGDTL
ncbi:MAG: ATP phosphoribosyltransferase regulatory subunit [Firmicutes bacterium]|nr:ATP phosphoribosyltransferase regulatory subunit [Bacillota bacterium]